MTLNYIAILLATIVQFIIGAVWYTPIFGKLWGKIHGFDALSKDVQADMMKRMGPMLAVQFLTTILTSFVLAFLTIELSTLWQVLFATGLYWLGFVLPTQISAVLFGGTKETWIITKTAIMAGGSFACLMMAAAILFYIR